MTIGSKVEHPVDDGPRPLTVNGVPEDPNLRIMAGATLVNTIGNGALMTTFALYFTRVVGLRPTVRNGYVAVTVISGVAAMHFIAIELPLALL